MTKSDIPFSSEFSPSIVELQRALELAVDNAGDVTAIESAYRREWFESRKTTDANKRKLAMNVRLGLQNYGLLGRDGHLTEVGKSILNAATDTSRYEILGKHILLNLNGSVFVQTIREMQMAGETITLPSLRKALETRGIHTSPANKSMSIMKLWLAKAGVFKAGRGYEVDVARYESLIGLGTADIVALADLPKPQRAYLMALAAIVDRRPVMAGDVRKLAEQAFGGQYNEKQLPKDVLYPLRDAGFITLQRTGGRGKPFLVEATTKFDADVLTPLLSQYDLAVTPGLLAMIRRPLSEIVAELGSQDKHIKGLALEALAFRIMWLIGLRYQGTRVTGAETAGAEVDLIFDSLILAYNRWQIQCKNTGRVSLDDVAKEVGLASFLKTTAITVVSTGKISRTARQYANSIMGSSNLAIILMDEHDIESILKDPTSILVILYREAEHACQLKPLRLDESS